MRSCPPPQPRAYVADGSSRSSSRALFHLSARRYRIPAKGAWYIGSTPGSETAAAVVYDSASVPEAIKTPTWRYYDSGKWVVVRAGVFSPALAQAEKGT